MESMHFVVRLAYLAVLGGVVVYLIWDLIRLTRLSRQCDAQAAAIIDRSLTQAASFGCLGPTRRV